MEKCIKKHIVSRHYNSQKQQYLYTTHYILGYMNEKMPIPMFILDASVMQNIIEGKKEGSHVKLLEVMNKIKTQTSSGMEFFTTQSAFQRAIWRADSDTPLSFLQYLNDVITIIPNFNNTDFKNENAVRDEVIMVAKAMTDLKKNHDGKSAKESQIETLQELMEDIKKLKGVLRDK